MAEHKLYSLDLNKLDQRAEELGLKGIDLLGLPPRVVRTLTRRELTRLAALDGMSVEELLKIPKFGALSAAYTMEARLELPKRPMSSQFARLRELAKPKPEVPRIKHEPLLPRLAEPFYHSVGQKLSDDVMLDDLVHWSSSEHPIVTPFMDELSITERTVLTNVFGNIERGGFYIVEAIRTSPSEDLRRKGWIGIRTAIFCYRGFGRYNQEGILYFPLPPEK